MTAGDREDIDSILSGTEVPCSASLASPTSVQNRLDLLVNCRRVTSGGQHSRYLGEVSDVSFFNSVKELLQCNATAQGTGAVFESYERGVADTLEELEPRNVR